MTFNELKQYVSNQKQKEMENAHKASESDYDCNTFAEGYCYGKAEIYSEIEGLLDKTAL